MYIAVIILALLLTFSIITLIMLLNNRKDIEYKLNILLKDKEVIEEKIQNEKKVLELKEEVIDKRAESLNKKEKEINTYFEKNKAEISQLESIYQENLSQFNKEREEFDNNKINQLQKISNLNKEEATIELKETLSKNLVKHNTRQINYYRDTLEVEKNKLAKNILLEAMQNVSVNGLGDFTLVNISLENNDIKGKLIGKNGRNFKLLETLLGVNIIIDDTPDTIFISSFNSIRRAIATIALESLLKSGNINQYTIEENVEQAKLNFEDVAYGYGMDTINKFNLHDMEPKLILQVGMLHYRNSMNQNVLDHSIEVAEICAYIAKELNLDETLAARCGLLHDIGKMDITESGKDHVVYGISLATKYNEHEYVINSIASHHNNEEATSIYAEIVKIADAISASRPGARLEKYNDFVKRITYLEDLALSFDGITSAYALRSGRELRVIVDSDIISDSELKIVATSICNKIEEESDFPGSVNVVIIKENKYSIQTKV